MSFLDFFFSPSAQKLELKGDVFFDAGLWGQAKQAYERALDKLKPNSGDTITDYQRISKKIGRTREALAREHVQNALNYLEGGYLGEARELMVLAHEISTDEQFKKDIELKIHDIELEKSKNENEYSTDYFYGLEEDDGGDEKNSDYFVELSEDEEFVALCNTLPEDVSAEYHSYGKHFKIGYIALNQGDFKEAVENFKHALEENPQENSYIPLELATAYLNLDQTEEAQRLLEKFVLYHPETLPAYQLLCEIYWDQQDFLKVETLLASIPSDLKETLAVALLKGETLFRAGKFEEVRAFYKTFLKSYGWREEIARELAKTSEALGETDHARNIYKEIIGRCSGCKSRIDPEIKDRYAELSFLSGMLSTELLEMYLNLAGEVPENAVRYFDRISRIYEAMGNSHEAARFRAFSNRAEKEFIPKK